MTLARVMVVPAEVAVMLNSVMAPAIAGSLAAHVDSFSHVDPVAAMALPCDSRRRTAQPATQHRERVQT